MNYKKTIYLTGGEFNRRQIVSYSQKTRPTSQKVRLAVFNSLFSVEGVSLDLFAGSGAYSFEALSRGLSFSYLNDIDFLAIKSIKENIKTLQVEAKVKVTSFDYLKALEYYQLNNILFDLVFIDPPYEFTDEALLDVLHLLVKTQKKGVRIVIERTNLSSPLVINGLTLIFNKRYGHKKIFIYKKD